MISSISSSRIWTPQPASATFQGNSGQSGGNTSSGAPISALAGLLFADTSDDGDDYGYSAELSSTIGSSSIRQAARRRPSMTVRSTTYPRMPS
jgi:hypothetical protein